MNDNEPIVETVQIDADDSLARSKLQGFQEFMQSWGKKLTIAGALIGGLGGTVQAAISKSADSLASHAVKQTSAADKYKVTTVELEKMQFQAQQTGQSLDDIAQAGGASAEWGRAAEVMGVIMSPEAVAAGVRLSRAMELVKDQVRYLWMNIGAHVVPGLTQFAQITSTVMAKAIQWAQNNGPLIQTISKIASAAVIVGGALTGVGSVMWGIGAAVGWLTPVVSALGGALITFLVSPMGMIAAGVAAGVAALFYFSGAARDMASGVAVDFGGMLSRVWGVLQQLVAFVTTTVGAVKAALAGGDLALASQIAWAAVKMVWFKGVSELVGVVQAVIGGDWINQAVSGIGTAWKALNDGFDTVVTGIENGFDRLWVNVLNGIDLAVAKALDIWDTAITQLKIMAAEVEGKINPFAETESTIKGIKAEQESRSLLRNRLTTDGNADRLVDLNDRVAGRDARRNAQRIANADSGNRVAAQIGDMLSVGRDAVAEFGDGFRDALTEATEEWRAGVEAAGNLPGALPGDVGRPGEAAKPEDIRRSVVGTFSGAAAGLLGGSASGIESQQLTQQTRTANGIDRLVTVVERNPGGVYS